ncbi:MAG: type IV pilus biogenesis/stability protein PilW [Burkholderiales bacterium]|nr:MAG: type IV pilus biogenesis/stability protein PilW [Betaproteobacteria bacterium]TAG28630.1 MAG: type IV pilus biogenesis/stability protein PilW [Burkholderiales bacterium]
MTLRFETARRWLVISLCSAVSATLVGCAGLGGEKADDSPQSATATNNEDPMRFRAKVHTELGSNYFQRGQMAIALEELNEAIKLDPRYGVAHGILGLVHADLGDLPKADASFRRAIELAPNEGDVRNNYGSHLCRQNKAKEGLEQFDAALRLPLYTTPNVALENAGSCALSASLIRPAEAYFSRLVQIQPFNSRGYQGLAAIAYKTAKHEEIRKHVAAGLRANPLTPELLFYGACAERKLGDRAAEIGHTEMLKTRFRDSPLNEALRRGGCE